MPVTVGSTIGRAKVTLLENGAEGLRWTNDELLLWHNESYQSITGLRPDASSVTAPIELSAGTKQIIPAGGIRLLDVVRNTAGASDKTAIRRKDRKELDDIMPGWHGATPAVSIEHFVFDEMEPRSFYVYPPAAAGAEIELIYSAAPAPHNSSYDAAKDDPIELDDTFAPAIVDYILFRAFSKDADNPMAVQRASMHFQAFTTQLGISSSVATAVSPNPPRGAA